MGERSISPSIAAGLLAAMADAGELAEMMLAGVAAARQRRQEQTERARSAALQKWREAANANSVVTQETLDTLTLACPSASKLLVSRNRASVATAPVYSLLRLVLSSKIRGSGTAVDRSRLAQQYAYVLVAKCALACQQCGLLQRLGGPSAGAGRSQGILWNVGTRPASACGRR